MKEIYHVMRSKTAWGLCALALFAAACNDDDPEVIDHGAPVEAGMPVEATLSIAVETAGGSVHTYSTHAASTVSNLWILEYDADGKCLASEKIESYTPDQEIKVNLVAGKNLDLYAIAGAGDMSFDKMSLSDLKAASYSPASGGGENSLI